MSNRVQAKIAAALAAFASDILPEEWITIDPTTRHTVLVFHDDPRDWVPEIDLDLLAERIAMALRTPT